METTNTDTRYVRENGILYKVCNESDENAGATGNSYVPYFEQCVEHWIPVKDAPIERPRCEHKGSLPHPATHQVTWQLASGKTTKFMCEKHSKDIGDAALLGLDTARHQSLIPANLRRSSCWVWSSML